MLYCVAISCHYALLIKHFSCLTYLSMTFVLLINIKLRTSANALVLNIAAVYETFSANKYENANYC